MFNKRCKMTVCVRKYTNVSNQQHQVQLSREGCIALYDFIFLNRADRITAKSVPQFVLIHP